ncbi:hypothetical protein EV401DRAFT_1870133 [Pisolithus croceorrhizus]|nr:hypothetical protein EV401DRAFT_1870133 [Pisolithus croceorrhizus]
MGPEVTGEPVSSVDVLQHEVGHKTDTAVAQGQRDVEIVQNVGSQYIEQAKTTVSNALNSAQNALQGTSEEKPHTIGSSTGISAPGPNSLTETAGGVLTSLQEKASSAVGVTQQYLASAQATVQPHIDRAREAAHTYLAADIESTSDAVASPVETSERPTTNLPLDTTQGVPGSFPSDSGRPTTTTNMDKSQR